MPNVVRIAKTERNTPKTDLGGAERWAGKICRSKSAPS